MSPRRRLPSLSALRAFEAAARHESFKRAAAELGVTPTSVSHQVKGLEAELGVRLFERLNRQVRLTAAGRVLAGPLTRALDAMDDAVGRARGAAGDDRLVVAGNPGLFDCWLRARLARFRERHPEIALELVPSDDTAGELAGRADLALHFGAAPGRPFQAETLARTRYFPVCSPALAAHLAEPADVVGHTLLHEGSPDWWGDWLAAAGLGHVEGWRAGPVFHSSALAIESAVAGDGIALADQLIAGDHLAAGRLVKPFAATPESAAALYLAWPAERALDDRERAFADWVRAELEAFAPVMERLARPEPYAAG